MEEIIKYITTLIKHFWSTKIHSSCSHDSPSLVFPIFSIHESLPKRNQPSPKSSLFWFSKIHILTLWI